MDAEDIIKSDPVYRAAVEKEMMRRQVIEDVNALERGEARSLNAVSGVVLRQQVEVPQLVAGVLPEKALFQVFGPTGQFKSFAVLDLAMSIANGVPWMGHEVIADGPVMLVLGEGGGDAGARVQSWLDAHPGKSDYFVSHSIEQGLDLLLAADVDAIIHDLDVVRQDRHPDKPWRLIVFDTQGDHMGSGDEDKARDISVLKRSVQRIAHATGAAVGLVHHTGWDTSRERGSSRQRQIFDVVMGVNEGVITNVKQKFGPLFEPIPFEAIPMGRSLVARARDAADIYADTVEALRRDTDEARVVLTALATDSKISMRGVMDVLKWGHKRVMKSLDLLAELGYVEMSRDGRGRVSSLRVTDQGREWVDGPRE